jgi:hypothetical protein
MIWARIYWLFLHASGYVYKLQNREFTSEEKQGIKSFLSVWCQFLHCGICINHCETYMNEAKLESIDSWVQTDDFWKFGVEFHNEVNRTTKKPELSLEDAEKELLSRVLRIYKITDMQSFAWNLEEFPHIAVLFTIAYTAQTKTVGAIKANENMKTLCDSLPYIMPFQFHKVQDKTSREIWIEHISQWDWKRIQDNNDLIYEDWRTLFLATYSAKTDLTDRMVGYMNKEASALYHEMMKKKQTTDEVAATSESKTVEEISSSSSNMNFNVTVLCIVLAHVILLLGVIWYVRVHNRVHQVEPRAKVAAVK